MKTAACYFMIATLLCGCSPERSEKGKDQNRTTPKTNSGMSWKSHTRTADTVSTGTAVAELMIRTNAVPERLKTILQYRAMPPSPGSILALKPEDRSVLLASYRQQSDLTNKLALTTALSFVGNEEVVEEFKNTLLRTQSNHVLNSQEDAVMLSTIEGLGILGRESDSAFQFLNNGIDPWFWKQNVSWRTEDGEGVLAGRTLVALAFSQRRAVGEVLDRLKRNPVISNNEGGAWVLDSALVDAAFWRDLLETRGFEYLKKISGTDQIQIEYRAWTGTPNGEQWNAWLKQWRKDHSREISDLPPQ